MKNISLALNALLILAVGFLYFREFSGKEGADAPGGTAGDSISAPAATPPDVKLSDIPKGLPVVFVNADSIFTHYDYARKAKAAGESRVAGYQKSYQQKAEAFQKDYNDYIEKAGKGGYTKEQGLAIEADLAKRRDEIMAMEQNQERVMNELDNSNLDVQRKIYDYLKRFNAEHGYYCVFAYTTTGGGILGVNDSLDVTRIVLDGLNSEYKATKK